MITESSILKTARGLELHCLRPALLLLSYVSLGKLCNLSVLYSFFFCKKGIQIIIIPTT